MTGVIWCNRIAQGNNMLIKIVSEYGRMGILPIKYINGTKTAHSVRFENGDYWRVCSATSSSRGTACNVSYVARDISYDVFRSIILPCTKSMPYRAIQLYGEGNLHITDKSPLPF